MTTEADRKGALSLLESLGYWAPSEFAIDSEAAVEEDVEKVAQVIAQIADAAFESGVASAVEQIQRRLFEDEAKRDAETDGITVTPVEVVKVPK